MAAKVASEIVTSLPVKKIYNSLQGLALQERFPGGYSEVESYCMFIFTFPLACKGTSP